MLIRRAIRILTLALAAILFGGIAAPISVGLAVDIQNTSWSVQYVVGFHQVPLGLAPGSRYMGASVLHVLGDLGIIVVGTSDASGFEEAALMDTNVLFVEFDDPEGARIAYTPNDPQWPQQWGPDAIKAPIAWDEGRGASDVVICLVDTGVDYTHPDLAGARFLGGRNFVQGPGEDPNDPMDTFGHGTSVTGVAVATVNNGIGVAGMARASFYVVRAFADDTGPLSNVVLGIDWCRDTGADIISTSLTNKFGSQGLQLAVEAAWNAGALIVAAAGNTPTPDNLPPDPIHFPAAYRQVIAVTCVKQQDLNTCTAPKSNIGPEAELAAPGEVILTTGLGGSYPTPSGTSLAAPHVAGVAALIKSINPALTNSQIRDRLNNTVQDLTQASVGAGPGKDNVFGWGLVRADNAIAATEQEVSRVASLQGVVWDQDTGFPISGVSVWVQGLEAITNANGQYSYPTNSLQAGAWLVEYSHGNYLTKILTVNLQQGSNTKNTSLKSISGGGPPGF